MDLQFLPYVVVTNPHIKRVYDSYQHAFETLHNLPQVKTVEQNAKFTVLLKRLVDEHGQSPPLAACLPQLEHCTVSQTAQTNHLRTCTILTGKTGLQCQLPLLN